MKVLKFGGSSVRDGDRIAHVVELIRVAANPAGKDSERVTVVVSALGGVTDDLKNLPAIAVGGGPEAHEHLAQIEQRHFEAMQRVAPSEASTLGERIQASFDRLRDIASGIQLIGECSDRTLDEIITFGERLSAPIVAAALRESGFEAEDCDARELIVTRHRFGGARPLRAATYERTQAYFGSRQALQVITGFVARSDRGATTHLGRGGSDLTAALVGAALDADAVEIWTDVDGVLTADPRDVKEAQSIREMSFEELMELSHFGAKVVYPPTVQPIRSAGIDLSIRNTLNPTSAGTHIVEKRTGSVPRNPVVGIAAIDHVSLLRLEGDGMIGVPGTAGRLFEALARQEISVILISQASSEHSICFAIDPEQTDLAQKIADSEFELERRAGQINPMVVERDCAVVAVVGEGMCEQPGLAGRVFRTLGERGTNVRAIAQGSSERNISLVVEREEKSSAVRSIHRAFFGDPGNRVRLGIVGVGGVGSQLLEQLAPPCKAADILEVVGVASSSRLWHGDFEDTGWPENWRNFLDTHGQDGDATDLADVMSQLDGPRMFIDCSASGEVADLYPALLASGVRIVAANKLAFADVSAKSMPLIHSDQNAVFEATVGAGLPVLGPLQDLVATGDRIHGIDGILSGTLAFVLDRAQSGDSLSSAVRAAFDAGYTEPDPREDLSGNDVARKLLILARVAGFELEPEDLEVQPLVSGRPEISVDEFFAELPNFDADFARRVAEAKANDQRLCYLARFDGRRATVGLETIDSSHPGSSLSGTDNLVAFTTERYSETPLVVRGPGAGTAVTAAGVLGDALRIAHQIQPEGIQPMNRARPVGS